MRAGKELCPAEKYDIMHRLRKGAAGMERFGFIHGELDTKILILFVLRQLPSPVEEAALTELCSFDGGVGWFDFKECLASLVSTGHVDKLPGGYYMITDKGRANGEAVESSIPFSVRDKASRLLAPLAARMSRDNMIGASHVSCKAGGVTVTLSLSDGKGEILYMRVLAPDAKCAEAMEKRFRAEAEDIYGRIAEILTTDGKK